MDLAIFLLLPWLAIIPIYFLRRLRFLAAALSLGILATQAMVLQQITLDRQIPFLGMVLVLDVPARALLLLMLAVTALLVVFVWRADPDDLLPAFGPGLVALAGAALMAQATLVAGTLLILLAIATALVVPRAAPDGTAPALKPLAVVAPAFACFVLANGWERTYQLNPDFTYLLDRMAIAWTLAFGAILAVVPFHLVVPELGRGRTTGLVYALALVNGVALIQVMRLLGGRPWLPSLVTPGLVATGVLTALVGGVFAVGQNRLGRIVAYSAIADLGCILAGIGTATTVGLTGSVLAVGSRIVALTLLGIAATGVRRHVPDDRLSELNGLARALPWTTWGLFVGAMAIVGLPLTPGFVGRLMTLEAVREVNPALMVGLLIGMAGVALAYVRVAGALLAGPRRSPIAVHGERGGVLILAVTIAVLVLGIYPNPLLEIVRDIVQRLPLVH